MLHYVPALAFPLTMQSVALVTSLVASGAYTTGTSILRRSALGSKPWPRL